MVGQILPNNNEKCYSNFSPNFSQLNTPLIAFGWQQAVGWTLLRGKRSFRPVSRNSMRVGDY
jgi:hypothetical protein